MRSTVSDSSGNPENREDPEYGGYGGYEEERYGTVPVREWVGPGGAGRVTDAWAAAGERAGTAAPQTPAGFGVPAGAPGSSVRTGADPSVGSVGSVDSAGSAVEVAAEAGPFSGTASGLSGTVGEGPSGGAVPGPSVTVGAGPSGGAVPGPSVTVGAGPDSVVDLVLDLVADEGERTGSALGATSASVSVLASASASASSPDQDLAVAAPGPAAVAAPEPYPAPAESAPVPAAPASDPDLGPVPRPAGASGAEVASPQPRDARPDARDLLPAPTRETARETAREAAQVTGREPAQATGQDAAGATGQEAARATAPQPESLSGGRPVAPVPAAVAETGVLVMAGAGSGTYGSPSDTAPAAPAPQASATSASDTAPATLAPQGSAPETSAPVPGRENAPLTASVPGPGSAPASASPAFTREDTGELRADPRVDTGRHQAVIANERTASIPVHLLFREEPDADPDATALPATVVRRPPGEQPAGLRRPPAPRTAQVRPPTRPAPVADPRLHERPGPSLPGWLALLTGFGGIAAIGAGLWWTGALPARVLARIGAGPRPYDGLGTGTWAGLTLLATLVLFAFGGLSRGRVGYAWVLTLFGRYRGTVRRTGLMWVSPLLLRRRVDVRLRHWRSEPLPAMDANGTALRVVVLVVWRVKDTVRAALGIEDHEEYLREQVEAAMARVLSQLPADAFHEDAHTLRNAEAVGDALTRMLKADCEPVGVEVYSAQPTGIEYAPEVAAAMRRRRIAAIDAQHRDSVLTSVVDAVDDTVSRLTARGLVELDDYERKSLVKDLTVAFYTGRSGGDSA